MESNYTYAAILDFSDKDAIDITFPAFDGMTCATPEEDYVEAAQDWLALTILDMEESGENPPADVRAEDISLETHQKLVYINVWMPYHRSKVKETYTKKTLTIPVWLDLLAKQNNVNFSETLVNALKAKLGLN